MALNHVMVLTRVVVLAQVMVLTHVMVFTTTTMTVEQLDILMVSVSIFSSIIIVLTFINLQYYVQYTFINCDIMVVSVSRLVVTFHHNYHHHPSLHR